MLLHQARRLNAPDELMDILLDPNASVDTQAQIMGYIGVHYVFGLASTIEIQAAKVVAKLGLSIKSPVNSSIEANTVAKQVIKGSGVRNLELTLPRDGQDLLH